MKTSVSENKSLTAEFWNRKYTFEGLPLPAGITVGGEDILTGPIEITALSDSGKAVWEKQHVFAQTDSDWDDCLTYAFSAQSDKLILNVQAHIYDDGLVWLELMLVPQWNMAPDVNSLSITIPLKRELCELLHFWRPSNQSKNSDYMPADGISLPFTASVWTGTEKAGFCFYMENAKNVLLSDRERMFELLPNGDTLDFKVNLFDRRPLAWSDVGDVWDNSLGPICYSFGFQATPVKEMKKPVGFERSMHACLAQVNESMIPEMRELGVKYLIFHEDWTMVQNYGLPENEESFKHFVDELHKNGIKAMVYFGYEYSTLAPGFMENRNTWLVKTPSGRFFGGWQRLPAQRDYVCCYAGGYSEVMLERVKRALEVYGLDGIYTDGTYMPFGCANEEHGCGYRDENGTLYSSFPLLAQRAHVKKLHDLVHAHNGIVDAHQSSCCIPMILGYADSYWDGEHIQALLRADLTGFFNMGTIRSEYTGVNWGIPSQFIVYSNPVQTYEKICGLLLLNNVYGRPWGINDTRSASKIWNIMDSFDTANAKFSPCWSKDCPVTTDKDKVFASCWENNSGALILIFSVSDNDEQVKVEYNGRSESMSVAPLTPVFVKY